MRSPRSFPHHLSRNPSSLLALATAAWLAHGLAAQEPLHTAYGGTAGSALGSALALIGDVDGDGFCDLAIGAPADSTAASGAGSVTALSGATGAALFTAFGDSADDALGTSVAAAGDVDGDGVRDLIAGAPGDDNNGAESGSARVYSGATGGVLYTLDGDGPGDALGTSVGGGGDLDDDGYDDFVAGAPGDDDNGTDAGSVRVYSGRTGSPLYTQFGDGAGDQLGAAVALTGDADGDGAADVVAGAPGDDDNGTDCGSTRLYAGSSGGTLHTWFGGAAGDAFGAAVASAGDTDGDGATDIAIGAPGADAAAADAGMAMVRSGATGLPLHTWFGPRAGDGFGTSIAGAGDVDGDGKADVLVGIPGCDSSGLDAGASQTYSGATGLPLATLAGEDAGDRFGAAVAGGDDVDGDGFSDSAVGAPGDDDNAPEAGSARVTAARPFDKLDLAITHQPGTPQEAFAQQVASLGFIDQDQVPDYGISKPSAFATQSGAVLVYSGADHSLIHTLLGPTNQPLHFFGHEFNSAGDIDQDGSEDILVGAWHYSHLGLNQTGRAELFSGATGASMKVWHGHGLLAHMGAALQGLGDVDGDQVDDFFITQGQFNNNRGALDIYSGQTLTAFYSILGQVEGEWFAWDAVPLGDIDGDGLTELAIGCPQVAPAVPGPGYVNVYQGGTWAFLWAAPGVNPGDLFGWDIDAAGDVNADGVPDLVVGAYLHDPNGLVDAGMVRVLSGLDGAVLHTVYGTHSAQQLGQDVKGAGDVDGDGYADFMAGAPGALAGNPPAPNAGRVTLYSGYDARVLATFDGTVPFGAMGRCANLGDINGDGRPDLIVGAPLAFSQQGPNAGLAQVYTSALASDPGSLLTYGQPCLGTHAKLPRLGFSGRPLLGGSFTTTLRTAPAAKPAFWLLGVAQSAFGLGVIGAPGCVANTLPLTSFPLLTNAAGKAALPVPVPNASSLLGASVYTQWAIQDPINNLNLITSDGGRVTVGQ